MPLPLVDKEDGNLYDFIANLSCVNGNPEAHEKYGQPLNIFAAGHKFSVGHQVRVYLLVFHVYYYDDYKH
jgi:hypothetical protein